MTDYQRYLKSPEWRAKREWALERAGHRCQVCNRAGGLHVHHRTYEHLGHEMPADLTVLCEACHALYHEQARALRAKQTPSSESLYRMHNETLALLKRIKARRTLA